MRFLAASNLRFAILKVATSLSRAERLRRARARPKSGRAARICFRVHGDLSRSKRPKRVQMR
jgi:hypothetical protein